jgi:GntR family transcriptional regulator
VTVLRTEDRIRAMPASREVASLLKLGKGESVLQMRRTAYGFGDQVIEFRTTHIRTSGYHFLLKQGGA